MDWIKIENLSGILDEFRPEVHHPESPNWLPHWKSLRAKLINGIWVEQFGQWRYVNGRIGFYGVFYRFEDWQIINGQKLRVKNCIPRVDDVEWHRVYNHMEMQGFSGFLDDDEHSSDIILTDLEKYKYIQTTYPERWERQFRKDGTPKKYISPRENLLKLHNSPKGQALYENPAKNNIEMTGRGSGKSHFEAGGIVLYDILFENLTYYDIGGNNPKSTASIEVTSGGGGKAKELLDKVQEGMNALADVENKELGVFQYEDGSVEPCPFWKRMKGSISANNKEKGGWRAIKYEYKDNNGDWKEEYHNAIVFNTTYSINSRSGGTKSAGGRRTYVINEEFGENEVIDVSWSSNMGLISESGNQMASQKAIGTSSLNQDIIKKAEIKFLNPNANNCLSFEYEELDKEACFFVPTYMSDRKFKDKDGNTDIEASKKNQEQILIDLIASGADQKTVDGHRVNFPNVVTDMFIQVGGSLMPTQEAANRLKELLRYPIDRKYVSLYKDSNAHYGVNYDFLEPHTVQPFSDFPYVKRKNYEGAIEMFIEPKELYVGKSIPKDAVWLLIDPYKADDWDKGGSLGAVIVWVNPIYKDYGLPVNQIAATYYGKPSTGVAGFAEIISDLHDLYGQGLHNVWYEDNIGGEEIRFKFKLEDKQWGLCLTPQYKQGNHIFERKPNKFGYNVSANKGKLWDDTAQVLKSTFIWIENDEEVEDLIINKISSKFLLNQIKEADGKINVDALSALQALPLALGEQKALMKKRQRPKTNFFSKGFKRMKYERRN